MSNGMLTHMGRACRDCRKRAGATQLDVALRAGVSHAVVSRFETGKSWPLNADRLVEAYALECGAEPRDLWELAVEQWP